MHSLVKEQEKSTFTVPFLGPSGGTKNETAKSQNQQQRPTRATNKKLQLRLFKQQAYRFGTEEARTCEAWFQLTFRPQKRNLKAHMWYQLSPFPSSNAAIAMQHHPGNIHQSFATPRYSATPCYVLIQLPNVIDTISKRWRSKKAFNTSPHLPTSFPKQILAPSRFKFILLINNRIDWNDHKTCSFWAENFGRSLEGQEGPTRGSKVFNTIIQMEADHLRENPQTPQQQETLQAIT